MSVHHFSQIFVLHFVGFSGVALSGQRRYHRAITNERRKRGTHSKGALL
nr:MAG TPA: hypothetical protein [Caudoviricetes sp.]